MSGITRQAMGLAVAVTITAGCAAFLATAATAAGPTSFWSVGENGLQIQNVTTGVTAEVWARFFDFDGALTYEIRRTVQPGAATNFYLPKIERDAGLIPQSYSLIVTSTVPLAAISRTEFRDLGAALMYSNVTPARQVVVPLFMKRFAGQNSLVTIQNTDTRLPAQIQAEVFRPGNPQPAVAMTWTLAPAGSGLVNPLHDRELEVLPDGFLGWLRISSDTPVTVQCSVHIAASDQAVAAFEGQAADATATRLFVPLFRRSWFGTTGIAVLNPSTSGTTNVTVSYHGGIGQCAGQTYQQGPVQLGPAAMAVFFQGGGRVPETGESPLPAACAGMAIIEAVGSGVVATVIDRDQIDRPRMASAYNAVPDWAGGRRIALPLIRNHHTAADLVTGIQVANLDDYAPARARLKAYDSDGNPVPGGPDTEVTIGPLGVHTWYLAALSGFRDRRRFYGSAIIEGDQPLAAVAVDASLNARSDSTAYVGLVVDTANLGRAVAGPTLALTRIVSRP